jgi:hypothetical protein
MKTAIIIALVGLAATALFMTSGPSSSVETEFRSFLESHRVGYGTTGEYSYRLGVFADNLNRIEQLNRENPQATFAVNMFADRTTEEMKVMMGFNAPAKSAQPVHTPAKNGESVNWASMWDSVKNQGSCGSCWAFSATAAFEARYQLAHGSKHADLSFAEQELVDCDTQSSGCNGGLMDFAFEYLQNKGFCQESEYPYTARDGTCQDTKCTSGPQDKAFTDIPAGNEDALLAELANGPVSVAVDANTWSFYSGGIMSKCGSDLDHGVTLIAADFDEESVTIRNSWGSGWGESGMIRLAMNKNMCGYANAASVPSF